MQTQQQQLAFLGPVLSQEVLNTSKITHFEAGTELLRSDQYVKVLPLVLSGLIKVYSRFNDKELFLYHIEPSQSCVMTFYAALKNTPSKVFAKTETDSEVLLIPVHLIPDWIKKYPSFNELFYNQFNLRYSGLLDTIGHLLLDKMDKRIYDHLARLSDLQQKPLKMSHSQIANELGTAREVVSRLLKKLEIDGKIEQNDGIIKIIAPW